MRTNANIKRHSGGIEEIADEKFDGNMLHSVVIPLMTGSRFTMQRDIDPDELQRNQWYVTTAGTRQSFAFQKLKEILQDMAMGKSAFSLGFDHELPCMFGLLDIDFVNEQRESPNMTVSAFSREYSSVWTGSSDKSLVSLDDLNKCRTLSKAEVKGINAKDISYVLAYDVARCEGSANANCALSVIKLVARGDGTYQKHLVNLFSFEGTHFLEQALFLKQKVNEYNARILIVDSLGLGKGLVDQLVLDIDDNPPYAVVNDERYKKYRKPDSIDMVFCIQGNAKETKNSNIHNHFMQVIANQKIKLLKPESVKKAELIKDKKRYDSDKLIRELQPFVLTDILCEEVMNLEYKQSGNQTVIKEVSRSIPKDKYSSISYGIFWIYLLEKKNQMRKKENVLDMSKLKLFKKPKIMSL